MWIKVDDETIYHSAVGEIRKCIPVGEFIIIKVEELTVT